MAPVWLTGSLAMVSTCMFPPRSIQGYSLTTLCSAIFDDGHHRQLPRLVSGPFRYKTYAADYFRKSAPFASKGTKLKQSVIAPSMLYLLYPLDAEIPGYSREAFLNDLVDEAEKDIKLAFEGKFLA